MGTNRSCSGETHAFLATHLMTGLITIAVFAAQSIIKGSVAQIDGNGSKILLSPFRFCVVTGELEDCNNPFSQMGWFNNGKDGGRYEDRISQAASRMTTASIVFAILLGLMWLGLWAMRCGNSRKDVWSGNPRQNSQSCTHFHKNGIGPIIVVSIQFLFALGFAFAIWGSAIHLWVSLKSSPTITVRPSRLLILDALLVVIFFVELGVVYGYSGVGCCSGKRCGFWQGNSNKSNAYPAQQYQEEAYP